MRNILESLRTAVAFLTRIPVGNDGDGSRLPAATAWFSLVGLAVGGLAALPFLWLPDRYAALLSIVLTVLITGALHEDGFADACDGVFGGHDPESRRAIMRDSRIGAYGAIGLWLLLTTRWLLLLDHSGFPWAIAVAAGFSRTAAVMLLANQRPEADPGAKSSTSFSGVGWPHALVCLIIAVGGAVVVFRAATPVFLCFGVTVAGSGLLGLFLRRQLGRLTGDALGAVIAVVEIACLVGLSATF